MTCTICGATTHHPEDIRQGYCARCHAFTRDCVVAGCTRGGVVILGNSAAAACRLHATELGQ